MANELTTADLIETPEDADIMAVRKAGVAGLLKITLAQLAAFVGGGGGSGVPDGGTTGQVLTKLSDDDGDADWQDSAGGGAGGGSFTWEETATGTGSSQDVSIPYPGLNEFNILVFVNGLRIPTSEYSVAGTDVTLTVDSADEIAIVGPVGELPPGYAAWRVYVTDYNGGALVSIGEMYLYTDLAPTDIATTGTPSQSSQYASFAPANFLDRDNSTFASLQLSGPLPGWFRVDFTDPVDIVGFGLYPRGSELSNSPKDFLLQYYDTDLGDWVTKFTITGETGWTASIRNYFADT